MYMYMYIHWSRSSASPSDIYIYIIQYIYISFNMYIYHSIYIYIQEAFSRIAQCDTIRDMFHDCFGENHDIEVLTGMNEVYVSSPHTVKNTSDEVFLHAQHLSIIYIYIYRATSIYHMYIYVCIYIYIHIYIWICFQFIDQINLIFFFQFLCKKLISSTSNFSFKIISFMIYTHILDNIFEIIF